MDRSILQDFEREDDGCVLNSYPSAWVLNRTGGIFSVSHDARLYRAPSSKNPLLSCSTVYCRIEMHKVADQNVTMLQTDKVTKLQT